MWESEWTKRNYPHIHGKLDIYYKDLIKNCYICNLNLTYSKKRDKKVYGFLEKIMKKRQGEFFKGEYSVELYHKNKFLYGSSSQTYRDPDIGKLYQGEFKNIELKNGKLKGLFRNLPSSLDNDINNWTTVEFHTRKRWIEMI
ncbi:MAG: hypothetical protein KAT05_03230 [Spirochaetes bacterium]|nr:hypothetical protein [Spirochaetota bacterium]